MVQKWMAAAVLVLAAAESALSGPLAHGPQEDQYLYSDVPQMRHAPAWTPAVEGSLAEYPPAALLRSSAGASDQLSDDTPDARLSNLDLLDRYVDSNASPVHERDYLNALAALASTSGDSDPAMQASGSSGELTKRAGSLSLGASSPMRSLSMGPNTPSRSLLLNKGAGMGGRGRGLSLSIDASMQVLRQALLFKSAMLKQRQQLSRARQNQEFLQTIGKRSAPAPALNNH